MIKRIHVNQHNIKSNKKLGTKKPVITIKTYNSNILANNVKIIDPYTKEILAEIIYRPNKPLACGAHVWIETNYEILATK